MFGHRASATAGPVRSVNVWSQGISYCWTSEVSQCVVTGHQLLLDQWGQSLFGHRASATAGPVRSVNVWSQGISYCWTSEVSQCVVTVHQLLLDQWGQSMCGHRASATAGPVRSVIVWSQGIKPSTTVGLVRSVNVWSQGISYCWTSEVSQCVVTGHQLLLDNWGQSMCGHRTSATVRLILPRVGESNKSVPRRASIEPMQYQCWLIISEVQWQSLGGNFTIHVYTSAISK